MIEIDDPYRPADRALFGWARENGLHVDTEYKDSVVRSISAHSVRNPESRGQEAQLWITSPDQNGVLEVHVALGTWHHSVKADLASLHEALGEEYRRLKARPSDYRRIACGGAQ